MLTAIALVFAFILIVAGMVAIDRFGLIGFVGGYQLISTGAEILGQALNEIAKAVAESK